MIDTHAHLLFFEDKENLISLMSDDGLEAVVNIGTTVDDSIDGLKFAKNHKNVYQTVGIYPEYASETTDAHLNIIKELAGDEKVVAIGEIGLDYHSEGYDSQKQKELFVKQLEIANEAGLPFCIHCRGAAEDVFNVLNENKHLINHSGLMHCYSEGAEWVQKFLSLGLYISFSGNITFKKNDRSFLKDIPLNRILVETDAPYLSPEPLRGRRNEPKNVKFVALKIANELGIDFKEFERITSANAKKFYFKMQKNN